MKREPVAIHTPEPTQQYLRGQIQTESTYRVVDPGPIASEVSNIGRAPIPRYQNLVKSRVWDWPIEERFSGERAEIIKVIHAPNEWTQEDPPRINLTRPRTQTFGERTTK